MSGRIYDPDDDSYDDNESRDLGEPSDDDLNFTVQEGLDNEWPEELDEETDREWERLRKEFEITSEDYD